MSDNMQPIVVNAKGKKKKKRKYTKGIRSIEMSEVALTRGANRLADAVSAGLSEYRRRRDRSSRKKKDGMIVDWVPNIGEGISEGIRRASPVAADLAKAVNHREFRNAMRFIAKTMTSFKYPSS
jgi:hypothetical protein